MSDKKPDLNSLISMLGGSEDMMEKFNKLSLLMGNPDSGEKVQGLMSALMNKESQQVQDLSRNMAHTDPAINLLIALKPYLSEDKRCQVDECLKPLNMTYLLRKLSEMEGNREGNDA